MHYGAPMHNSYRNLGSHCYTLVKGALLLAEFMAMPAWFYFHLLKIVLIVGTGLLYFGVFQLSATNSNHQPLPGMSA